MATVLDSLRRKLTGYLPAFVSGPSYDLEVGPADLTMNDWTQGERQEQFRRNQQMLDNSYYEPEEKGGHRQQILEEIFECDEDLKLNGVYNPVRPIVDAYQNVLRGRFGDTIRLHPHVGGDEGREINPRLLSTQAQTGPIERVWSMSNLNVRKQTMQEMAANLGTVGLRVVARPDRDENRRRTFIQIEHPAIIQGFDEDDRGNVTEIQLEYEAEMGPIENREKVKVKEILGKDSFYKEVNGKAVLPLEEQFNLLGVCPYVVLRHQDSGTEFGSWAYKGSEPVIHALNLLLSNVSQSVYDHVWPTWFGTAGGDDPTSIEAGRHTMLYVKSDPDSPPPSIQALVAKLDWQGALNFAVSLIDQLVTRCPVLLFSHIRALSGQSGETIAKLQTAAIQAVEQAKANYEDALTRAIKIALSYGILYDMWDLGAGMGSSSEADDAFYRGLLDFEFQDRPVMPESIYEQLNRAKLLQAQNQARADLVARLDGIVPIREKLIMLGYSEAEADRMAPIVIQEIRDGLQGRRSATAAATGSTGAGGGGPAPRGGPPANA